MEGHRTNNRNGLTDGRSVVHETTDKRRYGRGRGRGRSGKHRPAHEMQDGLSSSETFSGVRKPRLAHFISVPLGHIPAVRSAAELFRSTLLAHTPPIAGLDPSIIVSARRLHLTLGVMNLEEDTEMAQVRSEQADQTPKTVSSALALLVSLRPHILNALDGHPLRVPLTSIDIMKPEKNDTARAHVLFAGPSEEDLRSEDGRRLKGVCELVNREFTKAGFVVNEKRPLKLHCTIINTSHRKPRPKGGYMRRVPFSFTEIRDSDAVRALAPAGVSVPLETGSQQATTPSSEMGATTSVQGSISPSALARSKVHDYSVPANLGTHAVSEIQICRMGSWGAEGEYVCVGRLNL